MQAKELYAEVTTTIINAIEGGNLRPWSCPWNKTGGGYPLRHNGIPYRGVNTLWLWLTAAMRGYSSPYHFTFNQARELKAVVRKGEKSIPVIWCEPISKKSTGEDGTESDERFWIHKVFRVFNADQIDGLPERYTIKTDTILDPAQRLEHADTFIKNTAADIRYGGDGAFYRPSSDYIQLPPFESFHTPEGYYGTAAHELQHWTGHSSRLDRDLKGYGNRADYAREEIIAELGSVYTCASLGIAPPDLGDHAAYIEHWLKALKADARFIFTAASKAQASADYLAKLQPQL